MDNDEIDMMRGQKMVPGYAFTSWEVFDYSIARVYKVLLFTT